MGYVIVTLIIVDR